MQQIVIRPDEFENKRIDPIDKQNFLKNETSALFSFFRGNFGFGIGVFWLRTFNFYIAGIWGFGIWDLLGFGPPEMWTPHRQRLSKILDSTFVWLRHFDLTGVSLVLLSINHHGVYHMDVHALEHIRDISERYPYKREHGE